jgi:hypothetical protein
MKYFLQLLDMLGFEKIELAQILLEKRALINEDLRNAAYQEVPQEKRPKSSKDSKSKPLKNFTTFQLVMR